MKAQDRKAAIAAYKERKVVAGIYGVRCIVSGQRWVGRAANLGTIGNRIWFTLEHGLHRSRTLQDAWRAHGADGFLIEELERLSETAQTYNREGALRDRLAYWRGAL